MNFRNYTINSIIQEATQQTNMFIYIVPKIFVVFKRHTYFPTAI